MKPAPRPDVPEPAPDHLWHEALWGFGMIASVLALVALIAVSMR